MSEPTAIAHKPDISTEALFDPNVPSYYVNLINVTTTMSDVRLALGKHTGSEKASIDLSIYLSPPTAKQLRDALSQNIEAYERLFGPIPVGPNTDP